MKQLIGLFTLLYIYSCANCKEYTKGNAEEECFIVVETLPTPNTVFFKINGHDPITQKQKTCESDRRWWNQYNNEIELGDTIIKKKGELTFNIHKKDTVISHEWQCYEN